MGILPATKSRTGHRRGLPVLDTNPLSVINGERIFSGRLGRIISLEANLPMTCESSTSRAFPLFRTLPAAFLPVVMLLLVLAHPARAAIIETVEAVVNGEPITSGELDRYIQLALSEGIGSAEDLRQERLEQLINETLLLQEAEERGYEVNPAELEVSITPEVERLRQTEPGEIRQQLGYVGTVEEAIRELRYRRERFMLAERVRASVTSGLNVTEEEVEQFKRENPETYREYETVRLFVIVLQTSPNPTEEEIAAERALAEQLVVRVRSGLDRFGALAREYSDINAENAGDLGDVYRGEFPQYDIVFDMEPGQVSDPVPLEMGSRMSFHLLYVGPRVTIKDYLLNRKRQEAVDKLLADLRAAADIRIKKTPPLPPLNP